MTREPKIPGPDHPITVEPTSARVVVRVGGRILADTDKALTLREACYPAVQYVPLAGRGDGSGPPAGGMGTARTVGVFQPCRARI